jgi:hypothetical protein
VIGSFLDANLLHGVSNDDFEIYEMDGDRYHIEIKGTRIKQTENRFTLDTWNFSKEMESRDFILKKFRRLDFYENDKLSSAERELSSMFVIFEYDR